MSDSARLLRATPLTPAAFAPFGTVLDAEGAAQRQINAGRCTRFHALAGVPVMGDGARVIVSLFRTQAIALPCVIAMMERHLLGAQAFWPLSGRPWLVVVAPDEAGRPGAPIAFHARPTQGVVYAPGTWHHPLLAPGPGEAEFLVVDREGPEGEAPGASLEEHDYAAAWTLA